MERLMSGSQNRFYRKSTSIGAFVFSFFQLCQKKTQPSALAYCTKFCHNQNILNIISIMLS
ncbi:Uncharacterized protein TCM_041795 [Theobroma cacao]|uniref:Uncharacterized protein n=1 Tax=Theobroma cacao TaxID=3641 RepID=A0A061GWW1_THECC|nr:Uncharacterized protein TCM_041795 [Theobroma cacao]